MNYQEKERVVAQAWFVIMANEDWADVKKYGDIGFPLAYAAQNGFATLNKGGKEFVEEVYQILLQALDIPDVDYESFSQMNETAIEDRA